MVSLTEHANDYKDDYFAQSECHQELLKRIPTPFESPGPSLPKSRYLYWGAGDASNDSFWQLRTILAEFFRHFDRNHSYLGVDKPVNSELLVTPITSLPFVPFKLIFVGIEMANPRTRSGVRTIGFCTVRSADIEDVPVKSWTEFFAVFSVGHISRKDHHHPGEVANFGAGILLGELGAMCSCSARDQVHDEILSFQQQLSC